MIFKYLLFLLVIIFGLVDANWCKCDEKFWLNKNTPKAKETTDKCCKEVGRNPFGAWWTRFCDVSTNGKYSIEDCCKKNGYDYGCR